MHLPQIDKLTSTECINIKIHNHNRDA